MSYHRLFVPLCSLILSQSVCSMEHESKESKIRSDFHKELSRTEPNNSPPSKKPHKNFFLNLLTHSDAEPTKTKISPGTLDIIQDNRKTSPKTSPKKLDAELTNSHKVRISPRPFDIIQDSSKTNSQSPSIIIENSPKTSPKKLNAELTNSPRSRISPRKLDITEDIRKTSPERSPRKLSTESSRSTSPKRSPRKSNIKKNDADSIENTESKHTLNKLVLPDLPELPRSKSYNSQISNKEKHPDKSHKRTTKSKSTGDKSVLFQRKKSSKDLFKENNATITAGSHSPREGKKIDKVTTSLSKSDSMIDNRTNPSQNKSSQKSVTDEKNTIINDSPTPTKHKEYALVKFFSKSSGTENSSSPSPIKTTRPSIINKNDIINIVRYEDLDTIEKCINNPDVNLNEQNDLGMTALHYAALNQRADIIKLLLDKPSLDSTIKNYNKARTASQLIEGYSCPEIRGPLFRRLTLDTVAMQETFIMLMKLYINNQLLNDKCIKETKESIKNKIGTTETLQGGSELPKDALLNATDDSDANDDFIVDIINCRIPQDAKTTQNLIAAIHREIHTLLFNVEIDNTMIYESVAAIQKDFIESSSPREKSSKKSAKASLPAYATYQFIFNVIRSYIQEQKATIKPSFADMIPQKEEIIIIHEEEQLAEITPQKEEPDAAVNQSSISSKISNVSLQSSIEIKK